MAIRTEKGAAPLFTESSGNVFADLGLPSSPEDMLKVELARSIGHAIQRLGITQVEAAKRLGTDQAKISSIVRGRLKDFAVERLLSYVRLLGNDIEVRLKERPRKQPGKIKVTSA